MQKKVLFCATVDYHFKAFHLPFMEWFKDQGWEVHVVANGEIHLPFVDKKYNISIQRSPFNINNFKAFRDLKRIIIENKYQIIHCHTPMGGVLGRLASLKERSNGLKVIYTAHGFHFCKGAPIHNWIIYYPIELLLSKITDCLITINEEDYKRAITHRFMASQIKHVHGVGIDTEKFGPIGESQKVHLRNNLGYKTNDFLMFYAAEFNKNKNQQFLIKVLKELKEGIPNLKLLLAGNGVLYSECVRLAKEYDVFEMIDFLGFRNDIKQILPMCDIAVASSIREGLPVNIMEAMACGLPIVATDNRGHRELVKNGINGYIVDSNNHKKFSEMINEIYRNKILYDNMSLSALQEVKKYSLNKVIDEMKDIYQAVLTL